MADEGEENPANQEDIAKGEEPGATRNSLLLSNESYADLTQTLDEQLGIVSRDRLPSGSIKEIVRSTSQEQSNPDKTIDNLKVLSVNDSDVSSTGSSDFVTNSGSPDSLRRATPSSELSAQDDNHSNISERIAPENEESEEIDFVHTEQWRQKKKHVFILSEAGKPIYSRYGNEDKLVTIMGVLQAIVSFVQDSKNNIRSIRAGDHQFVFLLRDHLILVAVVSTLESHAQIVLQLNYIYKQVLSILTHSQLNRVFKQRGNYDLRRLLTGAEKFFDNLLRMMECDPCFMLGAVRCLPLDSHTRDIVSQSIAQNAKIKDLVFAIVIADNQLITLVRMKRYFLHPLDLHLIFNLIGASESFKTSESWTPICLPKFDSSGFLHAYISYLDEENRTCLLLLSVDKDMFFTLSDCKQKIQKRLIKYNCLNSISESLKTQKYSVHHIGIPNLRHFLYKSRSTAQYTSPEFGPPYTSSEEQERIFELYQQTHHRIHSPGRPLKILYHAGTFEALLGWVTPGFELYAIFGPLVTKGNAISAVNKLLKWIKGQEDRLFILSSPTF